MNKYEGGECTPALSRRRVLQAGLAAAAGDRDRRSGARCRARGRPRARPRRRPPRPGAAQHRWRRCVWRPLSGSGLHPPRWRRSSRHSSGSHPPSGPLRAHFASVDPSSSSLGVQEGAPTGPLSGRAFYRQILGPSRVLFFISTPTGSVPADSASVVSASSAAKSCTNARVRAGRPSALQRGAQSPANRNHP